MRLQTKFKTKSVNTKAESPNWKCFCRFFMNYKCRIQQATGHSRTGLRERDHTNCWLDLFQLVDNFVAYFLEAKDKKGFSVYQQFQKWTQRNPIMTVTMYLSTGLSYTHTEQLITPKTIYLIYNSVVFSKS